VAITRAKNHLYIITDSTNRSPFLEDIERKTKPSKLIFSEYPALPLKAHSVIVRVGNRQGFDSAPTVRIKDLLKLDGYEFFRGNTSWAHWHKSFSIDGFSVQEFLANSSWVNQSDGIEIRFFDDGDSLDIPENALAICYIESGKSKIVFNRIQSPENIKI
jgi:DNA helicase-4